MDSNLYLLWVPGPNGGWGVFYECGCPDPGAFPSWMYRKYTVPEQESSKIFRKLRSVQDRLVSERVCPTRDNGGDIFPDISALLSD